MTDDLYASFTKKTCPIDPMRRTTCQKCGCKTNDDPRQNMSCNAWCETCRYLLRDPDSGARYSQLQPALPMLRYLGVAVEIDGELVIGFESRQEYERIPNDSHVEHWPELQPAAVETVPSLEDLFRRRA